MIFSSFGGCSKHCQCPLADVILTRDLKKINFSKEKFSENISLPLRRRREHSCVSRRNDLNTSVGTDRYVGMEAGSCLINSSSEVLLLSNIGEELEYKTQNPLSVKGPH